MIPLQWFISCNILVLGSCRSFNILSSLSWSLSFIGGGLSLCTTRIPFTGTTPNLPSSDSGDDGCTALKTPKKYLKPLRKLTVKRLLMNKNNTISTACGISLNVTQRNNQRAIIRQNDSKHFFQNHKKLEYITREHNIIIPSLSFLYF